MKIQRGIAGLLACVATSVMILVATPLSAKADDRPAAHGWFVDGFTIKVNFPDDATYAGGISDDLTRITWSNGSLWVKKP